MTWAVDYTSPTQSAICFYNPLFTWITTHLPTPEGRNAELATLADA